MHDPNQHANESDAVPPSGLVRDLRRLYRSDAPLNIPSETDEQIRLLARRQGIDQRPASVRHGRDRGDSLKGAKDHRRRLVHIRQFSFAGAAALLVFAVLVVRPTLTPRSTPHTTSTARGDGQKSPIASISDEARTRVAEDAVPVPPLPMLAQMDINADGTVDILDAQRLAYLVQANGPREGVDPTFDINGDGTIDRNDALTIARHVVELKQTGGAG